MESTFGIPHFYSGFGQAAYKLPGDYPTRESRNPRTVPVHSLSPLGRKMHTAATHRCNRRGQPAVFTSIINGNTNEQSKGGYPVITKTLETALNKQVNRELYSAYLYLSMSAYFETSGLKGCAKWMRLQAKEEQMHAMKIYDYLLVRGGNVTLQEIEAPKNAWASPAKVFEDTYSHEQKVTGMINGLVDLAIREKDHATFEMLQWFVREQVEEEAQSLDILNQITCVGDIPGHLFWLDHELGKRE
jgi:ferritin